MSPFLPLGNFFRLREKEKKNLVFHRGKPVPKGASQGENGFLREGISREWLQRCLMQ
jgi:hypothetical protein